MTNGRLRMATYVPLGDASQRIFSGVLVLEAGVRVLLDCGWDPKLSKPLQRIEEELEKGLDLILLTHASTAHLGAFAWLRHTNSKFGNVPCYATLPVVSLGQATTTETYLTRGIDMSASDIAAVFAQVNSVRYSQPLRLTYCEITAYNAGHTLGGTLWKIGIGVDAVLYAADWNHARDSHLSGAFLDPSTGQLLPPLAKPGLVITTAPPYLQGLNRGAGKQAREIRQRVVQQVDQILANGGTVLLPTSVARSFELLFLLNTSGKRDAPIVYASHIGQQTLIQAAAMLEWMDAAIMSEWQVSNDSPFATHRVRHVQTAAELSQIPAPRIVLCGDETLETGLSRELLLDVVGPDPKSGLILTQQAPPGTLAHQLIEQYVPSQPDLRQFSLDFGNISVTYALPLQGAELDAWAEAERRRREEAVRAAAQALRNAEILEDAAAGRADESEESEEEEEHHAEDVAKAGPLGPLVFTPGIYDAWLANAPPGKLKMIPFVPKRRRVDDYGETLPMFLLPTSQPKDEKAEKATEPKERQNIEEELNDVPLRLENATKPLHILCFVACTDLNGLTTERSLEMIMRQVSPTRLLLIPTDGTDSDLQALEDRLVNSVSDVRILGTEPVTYERINFSVLLHLDPALESELEWHSIWGGYRVSRVTSQVAFAEDGTPVLKPSDQPKQPQKELTVGDIRLTALKRLLAERGVESDFRGQTTLVCTGNEVAIRRLEDGHYSLEGGVVPEFYTVREALRSFLASV